MTPEQKRIQALEETVLDLLNCLDEARIGFGTRFATRIRDRIRENRAAYRFTKPAAKPQPPAPPAAPVESETPA